MNILKDFIKEEDGIGVVEIILILVILIGLVIIFKTEIEELVERIFSSITSKSDEIL
jgi:Flp pilus assembly pilin Flp